MTVEMQNLIADREAIKDEIKRRREQGSLKAGTEEFDEFLNKLEVATKAVDAQERMDKLTADNAVVKEVSSKANGFKLVMDVVRGRKIMNEPQVLIQGGDHGENYLIPEDVNLAINEAKRSIKSAKDLVTVMQTDGISGSFNFDASSDDGLVSFEDGDVLDDSKAPVFTRKTFTITYKGAFIPVSDLLRGNEQANLMAFLRNWFVRRAIKNENTDIFTVAKANYNSGTPKALAGWEALKSSINKDLDPAITGGEDFVIVTNQDGFDVLDSAMDKNGKPILQPDPKDATAMRFKGHRIVQFSNAQLPNVSNSTAPIIYGDLKRAIWFIENPAYQFASDEGKGMGFTKVQTILRVLEGYAVMPANTSDYIYATLPLA